MSDAPIPLPAAGPAPISAAPIDPLAGDWSEGLPGPLRALGVRQPRLLVLQSMVSPEAVAAPAAWESASADPQQSTEPSEPTPPAVEPPPAPAEDAPTPWSEPVPQSAEEVTWEAPDAAAETGHEACLAPPPPAAQAADSGWAAPAEVVEEWHAEAAPVASAPPPPATSDVPAPDWGALGSGADWSAPAESNAAQDAWSVPAPSPAAADEWVATPLDAEPPEASSPARSGEMAAWTAPVASDAQPSDAQPSDAQSEWSLASPTPAAAGPAWNAPSVGASALEQLDSDPPEPEPGAAQELFGSVPAGGSLSADDDAAELSAGPDFDLAVAADPSMPFAAAPELPVAADRDVPVAAAPEVLAAAEDVLMPIDPHDDPDLPVVMDEAAPPPPKPLAALRPATIGALEVAGEHRVAVHTRGGRTLRGTLRDVDLSKPQFSLQPQGGGSTETIYHSDVKVIFFMLAPGEKLKAADGSHVRVKLSDGRVIDGNRDGAEARHGFFLVPGDAARTNTRRIYVAREAAEHVEG